MHFDRLAADLVAQGYCVLRYDLIGRGYSSFPSSSSSSSSSSNSGIGSAFSGESHVKQLRELIVGLAYTERKYTLIGHSMGKGRTHYLPAGHTSAAITAAAAAAGAAAAAATTTTVPVVVTPPPA